LAELVEFKGVRGRRAALRGKADPSGACGVGSVEEVAGAGVLDRGMLQRVFEKAAWLLDEVL